MKYFLYSRRSTDEEKQALSIISQQERLKEAFGTLEIIEMPPESASAFKPYNRPIFTEMMQRIENGEAQGIIAWHPDRLSRNPIDGAQLIYAIDRGILKDLKFCSYNFDNSPEGKMMLSFALSQSKYYSEKLGKDVMRGMEKKCSMGHYPSRAPVGYKNLHTEEKGWRCIVMDEERFTVVQQAWKLLLTGAYTVPQIWKIVKDDWNLTIAISRTKKRGERPITRSCLYNVFGNPFYTGYFEWNGQRYKGQHPAMITEREFETAQKIIGREGKHKPEKHSFPFTGFIRCQECGASVTAETKYKNLKNGNVNSYVYYHCTGKKGTCSQRKCTKGEDLMPQLRSKIEQISISPDLMEWLRGVLERMTRDEQRGQRTRLSHSQRKYEDTVASLQNLLNMYVSSQNTDKSLLTEEEFKSQKQSIITERDRCKQLIEELERNVDTSIERALQTFEFAKDALQFFDDGDDQTKRMVLVAVASNWQLLNGIAACTMKFQYSAVEKAKEQAAIARSRLEPNRFGSSKPSIELSEAEKQIWLPILEHMRTDWAQEIIELGREIKLTGFVVPIQTVEKLYHANP